jgi:hypothetical protein
MTGCVSPAQQPRVDGRAGARGPSQLRDRQQRDYVEPQRSPVFRDLIRSKDPMVSGLAYQLAGYDPGAADDVPTLEEALAATRRP